MKPSIAAEWLSFSTDVLPRGAPKVQWTEMRRAFYAGAHMMLCMIKETGQDSISEDVGVIILETLERECEKFKQDVLRGLA